MRNTGDTVRGYVAFGFSLYSAVNTTYCNVDGYKHVLMCCVFTLTPLVTYTDYFAAQSPWLYSALIPPESSLYFGYVLPAGESGARICRRNSWATRAHAGETLWWRTHLRSKPIGGAHTCGRNPLVAHTPAGETHWWRAHLRTKP